ncbi:hypothetical protein BGZ60DRAFT_528484 [Tricladium varicosporioides]|nr:hypothetical protein BGZ60DRAFT_528484 [Hymenoscyphus varicosporioides]
MQFKVQNSASKHQNYTSNKPSRFASWARRSSMSDPRFRSLTSTICKTFVLCNLYRMITLQEITRSDTINKSGRFTAATLCPHLGSIGAEAQLQTEETIQQSNILSLKRTQPSKGPINHDVVLPPGYNESLHKPLTQIKNEQSRTLSTLTSVQKSTRFLSQESATLSVTEFIIGTHNLTIANSHNDGRSRVRSRRTSLYTHKSFPSLRAKIAH